jgi:hypothetical protein
MTGTGNRRAVLAAGIGATLLLVGGTMVLARDPGLVSLAEYEFVPAVAHVQTGSSSITITPLSARSDMVSGGDVLVRVTFPLPIEASDLVFERNGADVTAAFRQDPGSEGVLGLVEGLAPGDNVLVVRSRRDPEHRAELTLTNHPAWGPVFAGPHEEPFYCTTHQFELVTGELLGEPVDEHCSVVRRVDYVYRTTAGTIAPLDPEDPRPDDVSFTTTIDGRRVPFIVRVETGTANRSIYEIAMLHEPGEATPSAWQRSPGWNGRLIYRFGGGCRPGWYQQGGGTAGVLDDVPLSRGYAIASSTLNVFANNCSELLSAETLMLVKERFVEAYGPPLFTIGWGSSGGSHQQHGIADNYPGLLDGLVVGSSFPDMTSGTVFKSVDGRLMERYFDEIAPGLFT